MIKPPRLWTFSTVKNVSLKFNVSTIITLGKCLLLPNSMCGNSRTCKRCVYNRQVEVYIFTRKIYVFSVLMSMALCHVLLSPIYYLWIWMKKCKFRWKWKVQNIRNFEGKRGNNHQLYTHNILFSLAKIQTTLLTQICTFFILDRICLFHFDSKRSTGGLGAVQNRKYVYVTNAIFSAPHVMLINLYVSCFVAVYIFSGQPF